MKWLLQLFTWWNEQTLATRIHTFLRGERVGEDEFGNVYYRWRKGKVDPALGFNRRWVIFKGVADGSKVPPGWYGWLHYQTDETPVSAPYTPREWEKPYVSNQTGTPNAWRPQGSALAGGVRPPAGGDYQAWSPDA